jgi:hypothetical protein
MIRGVRVEKKFKQHWKLQAENGVANPDVKDRQEGRTV